MKITSFVEEPLKSIMEEYKIDLEGETDELMLECAEHEGDVVIGDTFYNDPELARKLELKYESMLFYCTGMSLDNLPSKVTDMLEEREVSLDSIESMTASMIFDPKFTELYGISYLVYLNSGELQYITYVIENDLQ